MSTFLKELVGGSKFSVTSVAKRGNVSVPMISALPTDARFKVSGAVTKHLSIAPGDYVMLLNNSKQIEELLSEPTPELHAFAQNAASEGFSTNYEDANDPEFKEEVRKTMIEWGIAKGYPLYDKDGNPVMVTDKATGEEVHKSEGSRTNKTDIEGYGNSLDISHAGNWKTLKSDLLVAGTANDFTRNFNVKLDEGVKQVFNDGIKDIEVYVYPIDIVNYSDVEKAVRGGKDDKFSPDKNEVED